MRSIVRFALGLSLLLALMPLSGIAWAASVKLYLVADGYPIGSMSLSNPPGGDLPDYDPSRGPGPGLTIKKGGDGAGETDPSRYQQWEFDVSGATLSVSNFRIWVTEAGMGGDKDLEMTAYLMRCDSSCSVLDSAGKTLKNRSTWKKVTLPLKAPKTTYETGERLVVKIIVTEDSEEDMWFAYGVSQYDARLKLGSFIAPTTTTTTSTTTTLGPTTTTSLPPTTTTTVHRPGTTTTLPAPTTTQGRGHSTTTLPSTSTTEPGLTSTTIPPDDSDTTTTVASFAADNGPGDSESGERGDEELTHRSAEILAGSFENGTPLQPQEGLMVAFSTVSETSRLYWQAALALGALLSVLLLLGIGTSDVDEDVDSAFLRRLSKMN